MAANAILPRFADSASESLTPINRLVDDIREISLSLIDPPAFNPRRDFDEADLEQLATSLSADGVGLLQPLLVRPRGNRRFEVVAGHRRYLGAIRAGLKTVVCSVKDLDDKAAATAQLCENICRRDWNSVECAVALKVLCDLGCTTAELAELAGTEERVIGDRLAMLDLPDVIQSRIRRGEISVEQALCLVPWMTRCVQVVEAMATKGTDVPLSHWRHEITSAAMTLSRSMNPNAPDGPRFDVAANLSRLQVLTVELQPGKSLKRSFATGIWDELQDQADRDESEPPASVRLPEPTNGKRAAAERTGASTSPPRNGKPSADRRSDTPSSPAGPAACAGRFGEPVLQSADSREQDFRKRLDDWKAAYLRRLCREAIDTAPALKLREMADALGVDVCATWRLRRDFLELFGGGRLECIAAELGVELSHCNTDGERAAVLLNSGARTIPSYLRDALQSPTAGDRA